MTAVFIHGNPDTYRVWDLVRARIGDVRSVALGLPGFGSPIPLEFTATKEDYVEWVIAQLETHPAPVHLVGHDWGSLFTQRVASVRPNLVRSWAGGGATVRTIKVWHRLAKIWQTPGAGEAWMADTDAGSIASGLIQQGVPPDYARGAIGRMDALMKDCILKLYRSALDVGTEWESELAKITSPGLIMWGELDPLRKAGSASAVLDEPNARTLVLAGCGHWWPIERPSDAAAALIEHWTAADLQRSS